MIDLVRDPETSYLYLVPRLESTLLSLAALTTPLSRLCNTPLYTLYRLGTLQRPPIRQLIHHARVGRAVPDMDDPRQSWTGRYPEYIKKSMPDSSGTSPPAQDPTRSSFKLPLSLKTVRRLGRLSYPCRSPFGLDPDCAHLTTPII